MLHVVAFEEVVGTTANTELDAIIDNIFTRSGDNFLPQEDWDLVWAAAIGAELNRARIVSPTNRQITLPFIRPIELAAAPGDDPGVADYRRNPFRIRGLEELAVEATSDTATTDQEYAVLGVTLGMRTAPAGNVFTFRGTSTTAAVANTWTTLTTTWADTLPAGTYAIVGMELIGAGNIAGRLILEDQRFRPGCIAGTGVGNRPSPLFQKGALGEWGRFRSTALPQVQVLCNTTTNAHTVYMDIVRVAA